MNSFNLMQIQTLMFLDMCIHMGEYTHIHFFALSPKKT